MARTDSQGRYTFHNVPVGEHLVTIQKSGLRPMSTRVAVKPNVATEAQSRLATVPKSPSRERHRAMGREASSTPSLPSGGVNPIVISRDRALGNNQTSPREKRLGESNRTVRVIPQTSRVTTPTRLGQARGRVVDATSGAPIVGAVVAVSSGQSVVTGRDGSYSLNALPPGSYQVSISRAGFAEKRTAFKIRAGEVTDASFRLTAMMRRPSR